MVPFHRILKTAISNEEVGLSTSDTREMKEEKNMQGKHCRPLPWLVPYSLSKGVGDLFIGVDFKGKEVIGWRTNYYI